jgi:Holliday junction resolvase RusA-like endonuclease
VISVHIPGEPVAKGRPRFGQGRTYTPAKTAKWEQLAAFCARQAYGSRVPIEDALAVSLVATFGIPKSWSKAKRTTLPAHISRPDGDNILKAVGDAFNDVIWVDDSQIVRASVEKRYGAVPGVTVTVEALPPAPCAAASS